MSRATLLNEMMNVIPIMKAAIPADLSIALCDLEQFIGYWPGQNINLSIAVGQKLDPNEPLYKALTENISLKAEVPAHFYGFEFIGTAIPVHNEDRQVIGGLAIQLRKPTELITIADNIELSLSKTSAQVNDMSGSALQLVDTAKQLLALVLQTTEQVEGINKVTATVRSVADQTQLLGINAAIEAAHAKEFGRTFDIVAREMRKLSHETSDSAQSIQATVNMFAHVTTSMRQAIESIAGTLDHQAEANQQILAHIEDIHQMSAQLNEFAKKL
ncbi:methyl-accepting chemotaxis protein [Paenibacillus sp. SGZ-1009]|uniref:methyl-accepting chemotaxis protein n=1 Tax=Paenibacillus campi TaxID=3106031 RepID=UPI002AFE09D3|nr:methyl-accepting chemotaxis protein [Paenibacillus sp. SGZ-1009]